MTKRPKGKAKEFEMTERVAMAFIATVDIAMAHRLPWVRFRGLRIPMAKAVAFCRGLLHVGLPYRYLEFWKN